MQGFVNRLCAADLFTLDFYSIPFRTAASSTCKAPGRLNFFRFLKNDFMYSY